MKLPTALWELRGRGKSAAWDFGVVLSHEGVSGREGCLFPRPYMKTFSCVGPSVSCWPWSDANGGFPSWLPYLETSCWVEQDHSWKSESSHFPEGLWFCELFLFSQEQGQEV